MKANEIFPTLKRELGVPSYLKRSVRALVRNKLAMGMTPSQAYRNIQDWIVDISVENDGEDGYCQYCGQESSCKCEVLEHSNDHEF
jgi:hypothetical protein